jgi:hypothetical protein
MSRCTAKECRDKDRQSGQPEPQILCSSENHNVPLRYVFSVCCLLRILFEGSPWRSGVGHEDQQQMPIHFADLASPPLAEPPLNVVIVGPVELLQDLSQQQIFLEKNLLNQNGLNLISSIATRLCPSTERGSSAETFVQINEQTMQRIAICAIPTGCSRHNAPGRPHAVTDLVRANKSSGDVTVILVNQDPNVTAFSTGCAVARAFSTYALKKKAPVDPTVTVYFNHKLDDLSPAVSFNCSTSDHLAASIQTCQHLVGEPPRPPLPPLHSLSLPQTCPRTSCTLTHTLTLSATW